MTEKTDTAHDEASRYEEIARRIRTDAAGTAHRTGCNVTDDAVRIRYFGVDYLISPASREWDPPGLSEYERRLVLHYLTGDEPVVFDARYATFESLPNGMFYYGPFRKRSVERLLPLFGEKPDLFRRALAAAGAEPTEDGDVGARFHAFPRVDVVFALYVGDEEFPPEMKVLFPRHVASLLSLEDLAVLAGIITGRLLRAA